MQQLLRMEIWLRGERGEDALCLSVASDGTIDVYRQSDRELIRISSDRLYEMIKYQFGEEG